MLSPARFREAVALLRMKHAYSERRVCRALGVARSVVRHVPEPRADETALRQSISALAAQVRALRLSACDRATVRAGLASRTYARGADLAARGSEGAAEAAEASAALAGRWIVRPSATGIPQSRRELGLRDGANGRWPGD